MAKFRQGDLVLQTSQKITQGSRDILDENGEANLFSLEFDSGTRVYGFDIDTALAADSDNRVATQKAVKAYVDAAISGSVPPGTDESIVRYHGTNTVQESLLFLDDWGNVSGVNNLVASGDVTCNDIYVADSTIHVGSGEIKSASGNIQLFDSGVKGFETSGTGVSVFAGSASKVDFYVADLRTSTIYSWDDDFYIRTGEQTTGAAINLEIFDGSSYEMIFSGRQNDHVNMYYQGDIRFRTMLLGTTHYGDTGQRVDLYFSGDEARLTNRVHGGTLTLGVENAGGTVQTGLRYNPDGALDLHHNGLKVAETNLYGMSMERIALTNSAALSWENGTNWITHNDGGGNVQIRFGHKYDSVDAREEFTHGGTAFYIGGSLDSPAGVMQMKVASNGGAGSGSQVTWNNALTFNANNTITYSGDFTANRLYGAVWG